MSCSSIFNPAEVKTVTIANGASLSGVVDLGQHRHFSIHMPAAWTAANLTFQGAYSDGVTFLDLYDDAGAEITVVAAASRLIVLDFLADVFRAVRFIKVRSGTTGTPVAQAAAREIRLIARDL